MNETTTSGTLTERMAEHNAMIQATYQKLSDAAKTGKAHRLLTETLADLETKSVEHFALEDIELGKLDSIDNRVHINEHEQLLRKLKKFRSLMTRQRITMPFLKFLEYWLTNHIAQKDAAVQDTLATEPESES